MTRMSDMLHMACVCEGTVYSESIKTIKQVGAINQCQRSNSKAEAMVEAMEAKAKARVGIDLNQKADPQATVPTVAPVTFQRDAGHLGRNATIATKRPFFPVL